MAITDPGAPFPKGAFDREDESPDSRFYADARLVVHIDEGAIAALRDVYSRLIPSGARILDLMSSWRSHLPDSTVATAKEVVGHGMNADELRNNPQLTRWLVRDLNHNPTLSLPDESFDAVICAVSVQYMTAPLEIFREVARLLVPGAPFIVGFSNRMFPTKAVRIWRATDDEGHIALVSSYFKLAGGFDEPTVERHIAKSKGNWWSIYDSGDPLIAVIGRKCPPVLADHE